MRKINDSTVFLFTILLSCIASIWFDPVIGYAQTSIKETFDRVSRSLVKVECPDTGSSASGFLWAQKETVVTSLHVVDRSSDIQLYFPGAKAKRRAHVGRILKHADLVLLRLENAPDLPVLLPANQQPETDQEVHALGYPLNISTHSSTSLKLRYGGRRLKEIVPQHIIDRLTDNGYPDPELEIVNLEGNLVPGLSGAPIVNAQGSVVAVADGGLESGAIGISWGIPVHRLNDLLQSKSQTLPGSRRVNTLFAADLDVQMGAAVEYGDLRIAKVKSRSLDQLAETTDDPVALVQFGQVLNLASIVMGSAQFEFDIYQHLPSGATFVVPAGFKLSFHDEVISAMEEGDPRLEMRIVISKGSSISDIQQQSQMIERKILEADTYQWQPDPNWTYLAPKTRFDGLIVNRKGMYGLTAEGFTWMPAQYAFETLATKNNVLIVSAAIDKAYTQKTLQMEMLCGQNPSFGECKGVLEARRKYIQMTLATFFTSFSL